MPLFAFCCSLQLLYLQGSLSLFGGSPTVYNIFDAGLSLFGGSPAVLWHSRFELSNTLNDCLWIFFFNFSTTPGSNAFYHFLYFTHHPWKSNSSFCSLWHSFVVPLIVGFSYWDDCDLQSYFVSYFGDLVLWVLLLCMALLGSAQLCSARSPQLDLYGLCLAPFWALLGSFFGSAWLPLLYLALHYSSWLCFAFITSGGDAFFYLSIQKWNVPINFYWKVVLLWNAFLKAVLFLEYFSSMQYYAIYHFCFNCSKLIFWFILIHLYSHCIFLILMF